MCLQVGILWLHEKEIRKYRVFLKCTKSFSTPSKAPLFLSPYDPHKCWRGNIPCPVSSFPSSKCPTKHCIFQSVWHHSLKSNNLKISHHKQEIAWRHKKVMHIFSWFIAHEIQLIQVINLFLRFYANKITLLEASEVKEKNTFLGTQWIHTDICGKSHSSLVKIFSQYQLQKKLLILIMSPLSKKRAFHNMASLKECNFLPPSISIHHGYP